MDLASFALLVLTVFLSTGRNMLSKGISDFPFGNRIFYFAQATVFFAGSLTLMLLGKLSFSLASITLLYSIIYGILLLSAQWSYTVALNSGNTGICATVYSLGFIFPTLSGSIFWNETLSGFNLLGISTVIVAVIIAGTKKNQGKKGDGSKYIVSLLLAMLSSGGLGIMQKVQQNSPYPEQKNSFIFVAFLFAAIISVLLGTFAKNGSGSVKFMPKKAFCAGGVGVCFACCNLINTTLAGKLDSALLFPTLNIGTILLSVASGIIIYKERPDKKDFWVLIMGFLSIIILNL